MQKFASAFVRNPDGSWFCCTPAEFALSDGTRVNVTPGVTYRRGKSLLAGRDIAQWLDDWSRYGVQPPGIDFGDAAAQAARSAAGPDDADPQISARLIRAGELVSGGRDALAARLGADPVDYSRWMSGAVFPPRGVFESLLEIVLDAQEKRVSRSRHPAAPGSDRRILVADTRAGCDAVIRLLPPETSVVSAHTRSEAFAVLAAERVGAILCGMRFDESQLLRFLQEVKADPRVRRTPFIGYRVQGSQVGDMQLGAMRAACEALGASAYVDLLGPAGTPAFEGVALAFREAVAAALRSPPRRPAHRILIADPSTEQTNRLGTELALAGHEIRRAHSAPEALDAASAFGPTVAILDVAAPAMSGYALAGTFRTRARGGDMTLIATNGFGERANVLRALRAGFDYFFRKPVAADDVLDVFPG